VAGFVRTFAAWSDVDADHAVALLRADLDRQGAEPVDEVRLLTSTTHSTPERPEIFLAETRAIVLRNPNRFPRIRLVGWLPG
jgi:hypothetical protein